ncbi:MAG: cell division protein FtsL [Legionellales bacterium]|nr:cell division protein FtsL [Legionellales bacterium]
MITAIVGFEPKFILSQFIARIVNKEFILMLVLFIGVIASALSLSYQRHWGRNLHSNYQMLVSEANKLEIEWRQLIVEYRTWSNSNRIAKIARENLTMDTAKLNEIITV